MQQQGLFVRPLLNRLKLVISVPCSASQAKVFTLCGACIFKRFTQSEGRAIGIGGLNNEMADLRVKATVLEALQKNLQLPFRA